MALIENENLHALYTGAPVGASGRDYLDAIKGAYDRLQGPQSPPPSQCVPDAINALEKQVGVALEHVGDLMERLGPVLKPEPPSVGTDKLAPVASHSPLADRIDAAARRAGEITDMIQRIFGRLDI